MECGAAAPLCLTAPKARPVYRSRSELKPQLRRRPCFKSGAPNVELDRGWACAYCSSFMSVEVKIPAVGESISSGVVSVWHKKSGDYVNAGDPLFTLETDKVSTEIVAETAGVLE